MQDASTYVGQQLAALGNGPAVGRARVIAAGLFRAATPAPLVTRSGDGTIRFSWHQEGLDAGIAVTAATAAVWLREERSGAEFTSPLEEHRDCCLPRLLDLLEC